MHWPVLLTPSAGHSGAEEDHKVTVVAHLMKLIFERPLRLDHLEPGPRILASRKEEMLPAQCITPLVCQAAPCQSRRTLTNKAL